MKANKWVKSARNARPTHKVRCTLFAAYPQRSLTSNATGPIFYVSLGMHETPNPRAI